MNKKNPSEFEEFDENNSDELENLDPEDQSLNQQEIVIVDGKYQNNKIIIDNQEAIQFLHEKSFFGTLGLNNIIELDVMETLILIERKRIRIFNEQQVEMKYQDFVQIGAKNDERFWTKYLIYRDLRQRGYIVRKGFGDGSDFRVFPRGAAHQEEIAKFIICILAEGEPVQLETLDKITKQSLSIRKELVLAIIDRLGDPTYYKLEQFKLSLNTNGKGFWEKKKTE